MAAALTADGRVTVARACICAVSALARSSALAGCAGWADRGGATATPPGAARRLGSGGTFARIRAASDFDVCDPTYRPGLDSATRVDAGDWNTFFCERLSCTTEVF